MLFRGLGFDTFFDEYAADNQSAAKQRAEHQTHTEPELRGIELRNKQESRSVGVGESLDEHKRQNVAEPRSDSRKDEFDGVCVVTFSERRRNVACHRAVRHLRNRRASVPQQIHNYNVRRESAHAHAPLSYGQKHEEYAQEQGYSAEEHIGFSSSPLAARIVGNEAHKRVGDCVPELCEHHNRGSNGHSNAVFGHIGKHNARHHAHAAAVHKAADTVGEFLFERHSVRFRYGFGRSRFRFFFFHLAPRERILQNQF